MSVIINTSIGDLRVTLFTDERPRSCLNFLKLCKMKYYNFCLFHFIKRNFIAQTGDPTGTGNGGESVFKFLYGTEGKYFEGEQSPKIPHKRQGLLSMVNNGQKLHGSQFLITLAHSLDSLDKHTVFGSVTEDSFDVLSLLNETMTGDEGIAYKDVRILHTWVLEDPFDELPGLEIPPMSPVSNMAARVETGRIKWDEDVDPNAGKLPEEIERGNEDREGNINAEILAMVGDIPAPDVKPPENILFVCKLNPLTNDEDLEIIFSRFGKIINCEIIKDWRTHESLQYAFIEFDNVSSCEDAYFKMDNVLIDDRRIHVDFSQSVSKLADAWRNSRAPNNEPNQTLDTVAHEKEMLALSEEFALNTRHERHKNAEFIFQDSDNESVEVNEEKAKKSHKHRSSGKVEDRCRKHRNSSKNCKKMAKCSDCRQRRAKYDR